MALFGNKCSNCGQPLPDNARFCGSCGAPVGGSTIRCGVCHAENRSDSKFCKQCGRPLTQSAAAEVIGHRWTRKAGEIAVRVEMDDVPGLFKRGLKVEPGTNAMFIYQGANRGTFPPGEYSLGSLGQRIKDFFTGEIPERATMLLVEVVPADLEFHLGGRYTKDEMPIGISVRLQAVVSEPVKFLLNLLKGGERFTQDDLRLYLYPEVTQVADAWLRQHTLQELTEDLNLRPRLELALEERLKTTFAQSGLTFLQVRAAELNLEPYDHLKGVRSKFNLQIAETRANAAGELELYDAESGIQISKAEAEVRAKARFAEIQRQVDLQALAQETTKVEMEERKADLYQRMRQAVLSDKMNEVRSEHEFNRFLDELDFDKLLKEKERADLRKTWAEQGEDHDKARAHLLARLDVERTYELRMAELKLRRDYSEQELEGEIHLERMRAEKQMTLDAAKWEFDLKRRKEEAALRDQDDETRLRREKIEHDARLAMSAADTDEEMRRLRAEMQLGLEGLSGMKKIRNEEAQAQWAIEQQKQDAQWQQQKFQMELEMQRERIKMDHELNRLDKLGQLGSEALISVSGPDQARVLADLKKTEALKGMTEEQILALAAKDSPAVAQALQEKYRAIAEGRASKETADMYERILAEREAGMRRSQEEADKRTHDVSDAWDKSSQRAQQTAERALDRMADTAQAFARGSGSSGQPVIVVPGGGGPQVIQAGQASGAPEAAPGGTKLCPKCGQFVGAEARHCVHCGNKFEGV